MGSHRDTKVSSDSDHATLPDASATRGFRKSWALVSAHNPFYLLSTAFVLHGSARWMHSAGGYDAVPLIGLISAYVLMMGVTAILIVRAGGVWDDARSILLLVPVLFVELALALDNPLLTKGIAGAILAVGGLLFAASVVEGLIWGLRIRLSTTLRWPLHAMLALMFLYPLVIVPAINRGQVSSASWRIFLFSPLVAGILLALLPAVRRGSAIADDNGTPWRWPWFPWIYFGVLTIGLCVRGFALSLSFDPVLSLNLDAAMELSSAWGTYFLVPILLAIAVLVLEAGLEAKNRVVQNIALAIPAMGLVLAIPFGPASGPYAEFLAEFTSAVASPLILSLSFSAVFYAVAWRRRVPGAEPAFVTSLLLLAMASPVAIGPGLITGPHPFGLFVVASVLLAAGMAKRDSRRTLLGVLVGIVAVVLGPLSDGPAWVQGFVPLQFMVISVFIVGRTFRDAFAHRLRSLGALGLLLGIVSSLVTPLDPPSSVPEWAVPTYLVLLISLAFAAAYPLGSLRYFAAGVLGLAFSTAELFRRAFLHWRDEVRGEGFASFLIAFALFLVAAGISAAKAGLAQRLRFLLPRPRDNGTA